MEKDLYICTGCFQAVYCSPDCQSKDWTDHAHFTTCGNVIGPLLPQRLTLEIRPKTPGDLYYGQGSPLGYAIACYEGCKRPHHLDLIHGTIYDITLRGDTWSDHPPYIGTTPMGGPVEVKNNFVMPVKTRIDTTKLDPNNTYHLCCENHPYMGFPIRLWQPEELECKMNDHQL